MSSKPKNPHGDYEYLRSAMLEKEDCEHEHDVLVATTIMLCGSPYRLSVRIEAWDRNGPAAPQAPLCSFEAYWPNSYSVSWPGFLFGAYTKLGRLVADSRRDLWADTLRAQKG